MRKTRTSSQGKANAWDLEPRRGLTGEKKCLRNVTKAVNQ